MTHGHADLKLAFQPYWSPWAEIAALAAGCCATYLKGELREQEGSALTIAKQCYFKKSET